MTRSAALSLTLLALFAAACSSPRGEASAPDYSVEHAWYQRAPKTILVLPAENLTSAADADLLYLSTIAYPLVARGYYVIPPEITTEILRGEGIYGPEAWDIPVQRLRDYFGADAVLYVKIEKWDTSYLVVASSVAVSLDYRLVSTATGETIWTDHRVVARNSGTYVSSSDPLVYLIASTIDATVTALATSYVDLASQANGMAVGGLYPGNYHPSYAALQDQIAAWKKAKEEEEKKKKAGEKGETKATK